MAERVVSVEFVYERTGARSLAHAYRMLVPERRARTARWKDSDDDQPANTTINAAAGTHQRLASGRHDDRALGVATRAANCRA